MQDLCLVIVTLANWIQCFEMLVKDYDVDVGACYLGSAIVVTPFVLGKHTSVEERYSRTTSKF